MPDPKSVMYQRGCLAAARTLRVEGYPCPICGRVFGEDALTLEHAPPASLGGSIIALTCKPCNDKAGHTVDAALSQQSEMKKFVSLIAHKQTSDTVRGSITIGGTKVRVEISRSADGAVVFSVLDAVNDPAAVERVSLYLSALAHEGRGDGEEFTVSSQARLHARHVQVGLLRSAFIAAFAIFGYRYAFSGKLELVRRQIMAPDDVIIPNWIARATFDDSAPPRALLLMTEPAMLLVRLDDSCVLLPPLDATGDFYGDLAEAYAQKREAQVTGTIFPWPERLHLSLDLKSSSTGSEA